MLAKKLAIFFEKQLKLDHIKLYYATKKPPLTGGIKDDSFSF